MLDFKKIMPGLKEKNAKEKFSVGLDIGSHSIKAVKLKFSKEGGAEFCGFLLEPAEAGLLEALKKLKDLFGVDMVNVSGSGPACVIRYVVFPKMNQEELKQALKFEAQKHIPFSTSEINLDGYILKDSLADNKMLVLIAAVKKDAVAQRLKILEQSGLKANLFDIDSLALVNAFNFNYQLEESLKAKAVALLNIGASISNLNILEDGLPRLSRDITVAGNNFTQAIADVLGQDFRSAEAFKIYPEKEKLDKFHTAMESVLTRLSGEIRTSFDYYESQNSSSVSKIFLSGGGAKVEAIKDMLGNLLGIDTAFWEPLAKISISDNEDAQKVKGMYTSQFAVAAGLALRK